MRKSILMPHGLMRRARLKRENSRTVLPRLIRMSFQQSIPWRVALQQSPPPLPLPRSSSTRNHPFANGIPANGNRPLRAVSHFLTQSNEPADPRPPSADVMPTPDGARQAVMSSPNDSVNSGFLSPAPQDRAKLAQSPLGVTRFRVTFTSPGTFNYICAVHDQLGMKGTVIVRR